MLTTYEAILPGDFLEWRQEIPQQASAVAAVTVHITFLEKSPFDKKQGP